VKSMSIQIPKTWRIRLAIALSVLGLLLIIVGIPTGYIDYSLWGVFLLFTGQAIILQERKRPG
jgi:uncharacterized membrane protein HdeD (DUF308 family)